MGNIFLLIFTLLLFIFIPKNVYAIVDPLATPNNKFGIHIIQAIPDESSPAASLVNNNGDWGYITVLIESKDRNHEKWQEFFNDLRRRHLIPIVRLATQPVDSHWLRPYEGEEIAWADFLNKLNWPTKNRYVIIYNEPNHGKEWGDVVDAKDYANVLNKTITALKNKDEDFFVLNAGFDASAPAKPPEFEDQITFMRQMNEAVPGIFEKLDGWVSHSYPNPNFSGSPSAYGRGSIRTWYWELQQLRNLGNSKDLPIFITETGWKHAEGIDYDKNLPTADDVSRNFNLAFQSAWDSDRIVAVTPFLLNYQEFPFDHFSFKEISGSENSKYYPQFQLIKDLPKTKGQPKQENKAELTKGEIFSSLSQNQTYEIPLTFKNTGQSIWGSEQAVKLKATEGGDLFRIADLEIPQDIKIEPGKDYTFNLKLTAPKSGEHRISLNLFNGDGKFDSSPFEFTTNIKAPVVLKIKANLKWKNSSDGDYILKIAGPTGDAFQNISLDKKGESEEKEAKYLLPDYSFTLILEKPFYKAKKISQTLQSGLNVLDFDTLDPDFLSALLHPIQFWKLLPFSN